MRQVWFPRGGGGEKVVAPHELGRAPFALVVEHLPPKRGVYRINARLELRGADVLETIRKHKLGELEIYIGSEAKAIEEAKGENAAVLQQAAETFNAWLLVRGLFGFGAAAVRDTRVVRISFATLLAGTEIAGEFQAVRQLAKELTAAIDRLAVNIDNAAAFDSGQIRVYVPGSKTKPPKSKPTGTPPGQWS